MIIRVLAGLVVAPIAGLAALYGASMVFESPVSEPVSEQIPVTEPAADSGAQPPSKAQVLHRRLHQGGRGV